MTVGSDMYAALGRARVFELAHRLESATPVSPNQPAFRMALMHRHGDAERPDGSSSASELMSLGGHTGTHIDALSHVSYHGKLHQGVAAANAQRGGRFQAHGIESLGPIICRGVLLDVPAALGKRVLAPGQPITAADLTRTCSRQGTRVRQGDAVLIRTGWPVGRYRTPAKFINTDLGVPGPDLTAARWLSRRQIRVTGADTIAYEWLAPRNAYRRLVVHIHLIVKRGIPIVEMLDLEPLARAKVYEFLFVALPLMITGATASPIRPVAVVFEDAWRPGR
jgi:kynurenine formamidase